MHDERETDTSRIDKKLGKSKRMWQKDVKNQSKGDEEENISNRSWDMRDVFREI